MSYVPVKINLSPHTRGDQWPISVNGETDAISVGPVLVNGLAPATALARVRMQFRKGPEVFSLDSDTGESPDAPIIITNEDLWTSRVPSIQAFLPTSGFWDWDMEFWPVGASSPVTFYYGTISVRDDTTT